MRSAAKRSRRKTQREAAQEWRQRNPEFNGEDEDTEIIFQPIGPAIDPPTPTPLSPLDSPNSSAELQYEVVLDMVQKMPSELGLINLDNDKIRSVCEKLLQDNKDRYHTIGNLMETPDTPLRHNSQEGRQGYRPAAPIQRFNNKSLNWLSWFRHFRAVADVHG